MFLKICVTIQTSRVTFMLGNNVIVMPWYTLKQTIINNNWQDKHRHCTTRTFDENNGAHHEPRCLNSKISETHKHLSVDYHGQAQMQIKCLMQYLKLEIQSNMHEKQIETAKWNWHRNVSRQEHHAKNASKDAART